MEAVRIMFVSAALSVAACGAPSFAQPSGVAGYDLIEIKPLEGHLTTGAKALDDYARVLARSSTAPSTPIVWINGQTLIVPPPPGYGIVLPGDIGSGGVLVGTAYEDPGAGIHAAAWSANGSIRILDLLPGTTSSTARSVDSQPWPSALSGGDCGGAITYAATWRGVSVTQIGPSRSGANAVNNLGHAVGASYNELYRVSRPTLWRDGQTIDIGGEPYDQDGTATGVNDWTEAVGNLPDLRRPFRWFNGHTVLLPRLASCNSMGRAWAVNDFGLIVGQDAEVTCERFHAMIWERLTPRAQVPPEYAVFDLNDYIPRYQDTELSDAKDINNAGQIAAYGEFPNRQGRGYLVTPYLFEMSDPVPGRAGTVNTITVTGLQPNQRVHLVWGTQEGAQKVRAACPGGTLLIRDPIALPAVRADVNGVATITVNVPLIARGRTVRLQAVAPVECQISHTVTWTFE
ncbi:MAG: hypothetical protein KJZ69_06985 [Phycisphaerales bacterium]|nr:hypothetical protein [Phycisphaerales bacterium]